MQEFTRINLWDICHYWHGFNPQKTDPNNLPVEVQVSIRALTFKLRNTLYFKCELNSFSHRLFYQEHKPLRLLARDFQRKLKKAYTGKSYNKKFLQTLDLGRLRLLMWCRDTNTKPPSFWFDDDDPILNKPIEDNLSGLPEDEKRKYGYFAMFETKNENKQEQKCGSKLVNNNSNNLTDVSEEQKLDEAVKDAIRKMNSENAKAKYQRLDQHKDQFKAFYLDNHYKNKSQAARDYFTKLSIQERKIVVPSYYENNHANGLINAVRTLTKALRK